jgi:rubrerythrin
MKEPKFANFKDVIEFAVRREEEAARSYREMANSAGAEDLRKMLLGLEADEKSHKLMLQNINKSKVRSSKPAQIVDLKISDYTVEEELRPDIDLQGLLIFAAHKELKAFKLYSDLAKKAGSPEEKKVFEFLAAQEKSHKLKLEMEYDKHILSED